MAPRPTWIRTSFRMLVVGFIALTAVVAAPATCAADEMSDLISQIEGKYKDVTTIRADVTQIKRNEIFGDETVKGEIVLKKPAKMRWSFDGGLFVTDGKKMWIYTAEDKQVIEYPDMSGATGSAENMLTSLDKLTEQFDVEILTSGPEGHELKLSPKSSQQAQEFKQVEMSLTGDLDIRRVVLTDTFDSVTVMTLDNLVLNGDAPDTLFTFTAPSGVDVIKAQTN